MDRGVTARRVLVRGTVAGVLATAVMSTVFVGAERLGMLGRKPPRIIVDHLLPAAPKRASDRLALVGHLAYGAVGGVGFAALPAAARRSVGRRAASGLVYGLVVWAAGYEGWLPSMRMLPPAHRDRPDRAGAILAAHVVYGVSLGLLTGRVAPRSHQEGPAAEREVDPATGSGVNP